MRHVSRGDGQFLKMIGEAVGKIELIGQALDIEKSLVNFLCVTGDIQKCLHASITFVNIGDCHTESFCQQFFKFFIFGVWIIVKLKGQGWINPCGIITILFNHPVNVILITVKKVPCVIYKTAAGELI